MGVGEETRTISLTVQIREILLGNSNKTVRFRPIDTDPNDLENGQIVQLQQRIMDGE